MGFGDFLKGQFIDVIEHVDDKNKQSQAIDLLREISRDKDEEEKRQRQEHEVKIKIEKYKIITILTILVVAMIIIMVFVVNNLVIPQVHYSQATKLLENKQYNEALVAFEKMDGYKDSKDKISACNYELAKQCRTRKDYANELAFLNKSGDYASSEEIAIATIMGAEIGDTVLYGKYEQDNNLDNGSEAIKWEVIDISNGKVMLLSKFNLDCKKYNETWANTSWDDCTLRKWLNEDFLSNAFDDQERSKIESHTEIGDSVFVLSLEEWNNYANASEGTHNTKFAISKGVYNEDGIGWTWLRDAGIGQDHAQEVDCIGNVNEYGSFVDCNNEGVRPAIIIGGGN